MERGRLYLFVADAITNAVNEKDEGGKFGGYDYLAEIPVTLSIGGSAWRGNIKDYNSTNLLKIADNVLYQSKGNGGDCYHFLPTI